MKRLLGILLALFLVGCTVPAYAAITEANPRAEYTAAGGDTFQCADTGDASQGWPIWVKTDLRVWLSGVVQAVDTDYTVTFTAGDKDDCAITFVSTPSLGLSVVLERAVDQERASDFATSGPFSMASLNTQVDYLTTLAQDNRAKINRAARLDPGVAISDSFTRLPQPEASTVLGYDTNGAYANLVYSFTGTLDGSNIGNYTELRALSGQAAGDLSLVAGRNSAGDGGGGAFVWNTNNLAAEVTADPLHGLFVAPSTDLSGASGAWVRQVENKYYVNWFGADGTAVNDQLAFDALSDWMTANTVGTMTAQPGTYLLADWRLHGNITFDGQGWGVILKASGAVTDGVVVMFNPNAYLINTRVEGDNVADVCVRMFGNNFQESALYRNKIIGCTTYSLEVNDGNVVKLVDNIFNAPVFLTGADDIRVESNVFEGFDADFALKIGPGGTDVATSAKISNNWFEASALVTMVNAIVVDGAFNTDISNNHFNFVATSATSTINVRADSNYTKITNNNFQNSPAGGKAIIVDSGALKTFLSYNRGAGTSYTDSGSDTYVMDGAFEAFASRELRDINGSAPAITIDPASTGIYMGVTGTSSSDFLAKSGADFKLSASADLILDSTAATGAVKLIVPLEIRSFTTGGRPSAASYTSGAMIYDTTLSRPIWSDSTIWRDSDGNAI